MMASTNQTCSAYFGKKHCKIIKSKVSDKVFGTARLIPQSLQLTTQVTLGEPWLLSQVGKVRDVMCVYIVVFLQSERWRCQYLSVYAASVIT